MSINIVPFVTGYLSNNTYLLYDKEISNSAILIDPAQSYDLVISYLKNEDLVLTDIYLTHAHFDHIYDTCRFADLGVKIHMHRNELPNLNSNLQIKALISKSRTIPKIDYFFEDGQVYSCPFSKIEIMHTPGHSAGSCCFSMENNLFAGDTIFYLSYGRTDFFDGSFDEIVSSIKRIFSLKENVNIFPGHGEFTSLNFEKKYNPILEHF